MRGGGGVASRCKRTRPPTMIQQQLWSSVLQVCIPFLVGVNKNTSDKKNGLSQSGAGTWKLANDVLSCATCCCCRPEGARVDR